MAQGFWSKRKETITTAGSYIKATSSVSKPAAIAMTIVGILLVGGLLFGIFTGTKWAYSALIGKDTNVVTTSTTTDTGPSITETSSTSTTTPSSTPTTTAPPTQPTPIVAVATPTTVTSNKIPQTGPGSNTLFFFATAFIGYALYRRKTLSNQK